MPVCSGKSGVPSIRAFFGAPIFVHCNDLNPRLYNPGFLSWLILTGNGGLNQGILLGNLSSVAVKGSIDAQ